MRPSADDAGQPTAAAPEPEAQIGEPNPGANPFARPAADAPAPTEAEPAAGVSPTDETAVLPLIGPQTAEQAAAEAEQPAAEQTFAELLEEIRRQVLEGHMRNVTEAMRNPDPEQMARLKDMVADLNTMLERRAAGDEPTQEEFDEFMRRHGEFFPEQPANLDELLEALATRAAAFSRFMASLTPEQRAELMELAEALLDDVDLAFEMDRLGGNLRTLAPGLSW
ncbi:MAG: hypothetical protein ABWZ67_07410, partial [Solirubrobacteraceae bacterium]